MIRLKLLYLLCILNVFLLSLNYFLINSFKPMKSPTNVSIPIIVVSPSSTPTPPAVVTLGLVGDLGLGRFITSTARSKKDFSWSFKEVSGWLKDNDFNLANLESPIIKDCPTGLTGTFTFCGDAKFIPYLKENKFILNLNNNHILNYQNDGLVQTKKFLNDEHVTNFYDNFSTATFNGITFGFLGFDFVTYPDVIASEARQSLILNTIKTHDSQVDWLIVSIHWGNEYLPTPEIWRQQFAHQLVDNGADIIHGHHPHVWQGNELYRDKIIYYSLGNFIFDQSWSYATSHSNIVRLTLSKDKIIKKTEYPIEIKFNSQPHLLEASIN